MNSLLTSGIVSLLALFAYVLDEGIGQSGFDAFWTGVVLAALAATGRSVLRDDFGAAVAWGYTAVFAALAPVLLTLPLTNMSVLWDRSTCDLGAPCSPAPAAMWAPFLLYTASLIFAWRSVGASKTRHTVPS
jgi:hypothetical protein